MAVYHIMKDGTMLDDITGHVVRYEGNEVLYNMLANWSTTQPAAPKKQPTSRPKQQTIHNARPGRLDL